MAHATNSATNPIDFLQQLVTWLVTRGWTSNLSQAEGSGWRAHLSKNGVFVNFRAFINEANQFQMGTTNAYTGISFYVGTGYNSGGAWNAQPGGPVVTGTSNHMGVVMRMTSGALPSFHLFDDGEDNITVVVEKSAGYFQHLGWGQLIKAGSFTGGAYFFGSDSCYFGWNESYYCPFTNMSYDGQPIFYVLADVDSFTGKWVTCDTSSSHTGKTAYSPVQGRSTFANNTSIPGYGGYFQDHQTSTQNGQANLLPLRVYVARDTYGASLLGTVSNIYYLIIGEPQLKALVSSRRVSGGAVAWVGS